MLLSYGSTGDAVRALQGALNALPPTLLPLLTVDGFFGGKTHSRVLEFQRNHGLVADGIAGPNTLAVVEEQSGNGVGNGPPPPTSNVTVEAITKNVLGLETQHGLVRQFVPALPMIDLPTFRAGDPENMPAFSFTPLKVARLGIFACGKAGVERSVILFLPENGVPQNVLIGVSHQFKQNTAHYEGLGWTNPRSAPLIHFVLLKHLIRRWAPQVLTAPQPTAFFHIVRAAGGHELGPFQNDGAFVKEALQKMSALTNNAFGFSSVQAFTFSNGIFDFNDFLSGIQSSLNVTRVISMDPRYAFKAKVKPGVVAKQYLSGQTHPAGGPVPGFEFLPFKRWWNEPSHPMARTLPSKFQYLHNYALPNYTLSLGLRS